MRIVDLGNPGCLRECRTFSLRGSVWNNVWVKRRLRDGECLLPSTAIVGLQELGTFSTETIPGVSRFIHPSFISALTYFQLPLPFQIPWFLSSLLIPTRYR